MLRRLIALMSVALFVLTPMAISASRDSESARRKARYYFLQGAVAEAEGENDAAYEYFRKAYQTDPTYPEGAWNYGMNRATNNNGTLADDSAKLSSVKISYPLVEKYPADYYPVLTFAYMATLADTTSLPVDVMERMIALRPDKPDALAYLTQYAEIRDDMELAYDALDRYEKVNGLNATITMKKCGYLMARGDTLGTIAEADRLVSSNPHNPDFQNLRGNIYEVFGQTDSALAAYARADRLDPESGLAKQLMANIYLSRGDSALYDRMTYESLLCEGLDLNSKLGVISRYLQTAISSGADSQRGDTLFNVLRSQYPHDPKVLTLSSNYLASKGNFKEATEEIRYAIDMDNQSSHNWLSLMRYQVHDSLFSDAMDTYRRAREVLLSPPDIDMKMLYASLALECDSIDAAIDTYDELLGEIVPGLSVRDSLTDKRPFADLTFDKLVNLSLIYEGAGDAFYASDEKNLPITYRCYDNALFFYPDNALALNNYAYFLLENSNPEPKSKEMERIKNMSRKSLDVEPDNTTYLDTYAWILFRDGDYKEALEYQQKAVQDADENNPDNVELFSHFGDILFMNRQPDRAVEYWEKALRLNPSDALLKRKVESRTFFYE